MRQFPAALERLTEQFARLPGIGGKTAQRLAFHVLSLPEEEAEAFAQAIVGREEDRPPVQRLPEPDRPGGLSHLRRRGAGPRPDLRGGRAPGRGGHGAVPGVPGRVPCAPRRHLAAEPRGPRRSQAPGAAGPRGPGRRPGGHHGHQPRRPRARPRPCMWDGS